VITGSTRHDALPQAAQALTGRLHLMTIYPLSQGEISSRSPGDGEVGRGHADRLVCRALSVTAQDRARTVAGRRSSRLIGQSRPLCSEHVDSALQLQVAVESLAVWPTTGTSAASALADRYLVVLCPGHRRSTRPSRPAACPSPQIGG
jgi:hypothetical protein